MDYTEIRNLPLMFFEQAERKGRRPFLWRKLEGKWRKLSWAEVAEAASRLSRALRARGIGPGDRVALVSENRPEWLIADVAIMAAGAISVPAYTTNTADDHRYILDSSGAKAVIVSSSKLAERLLPAASRAPSVEFLVSIESLPPGSEQELRCYLWQDMLEEGAGQVDDVRAVAAQRARSDIACLIYTSGTGGAPKGVMLSHGAIICNCMGAADVLAELGLGREVFLSFLPLSHAYEHSGGQFFPISIGAEIYYAEGADALAQNFLEARATIITAVPRLYEVLHGRITKGVERASPLKRLLFERTLALGRKAYEEPGSLTLPERLLDRLLDLLVRRKVRRRFGGRLKAFVSGGAPLNYEVGVFFIALGVRLLQGYGQTEAAPVISCNRPSRIKLHTVGPPLKGVEVKRGEDGEILVKGELLMQGYWGDPEATQRTIRDGWLYTADIGRIDADGYIEITDRKRDIIVVSGGDNVSPQKIEGFLTLQPEIAQAMVVGDRRPYLSALIVPDKEWAGEWAAGQGRALDLASLVEDDNFRQAMSQAIERVNLRLSSIERVRQFVITANAFTQDNAMLTPTLKIRRHEIRKVHGARLDALYEGR
ncbi:MAG: long-chain fatty acid--CoA ligase [Proteobacteria bacterium]|nr:long-chain fatty acid--CoA ligase [Pseudomonadota bacterium]MBI3498707.1 long-chain fatty acid--CoA ligase [Pseudomonadota bacterium]